MTEKDRQEDQMLASERTRAGFGRVLILVYGIFALSATARASVQLIRDWHQAPIPYLLSAFAAVVYIVATVALARGTERARSIAWTAVLIELVGVVAVGIFSFARPELFGQATVWSHLGQGYGFIPLVLPVLGLWWLQRTRLPGSRPEPSTNS